jgi:pyridoxine/pyridoxamine 5'-phosphate oxidase
LIEGEKLIQKTILFYRQVQVELSNKGHELSSEINIRNLIHWTDLTREQQQQQRGISFTDVFHPQFKKCIFETKKSQSEQNTIQNFNEKNL